MILAFSLSKYVGVVDQLCCNPICKALSTVISYCYKQLRERPPEPPKL